jgi:hypothetical protein
LGGGFDLRLMSYEGRSVRISLIVGDLQMASSWFVRALPSLLRRTIGRYTLTME